MTPDAPSDVDREALSDQHAVITGGSRGIGAACAEALATGGATLTLVGRTAESLEAQTSRLRDTFGADVGYQVADVTHADAMNQSLEAAAGERGPITVLVNNAGGAESAPLVDLDEDSWRQTLELNLTAAYRGMRAVIPAMKSAGFGRIVNIASTAGLRGYPYVSAYCAAKHGLIGLTRSTALELAGTGITVNAVCPGFTETDMLQRSLDRIVDITGRSEDEAREALVAHNPQGRMIQPHEVAAVVLFLCLPSSASITGTALPIAGGEVA